MANQRGVPTVRQLIILFDAGTVPDVHIDTTRLLAHTPDWQDHLMHVMTYVWSFPPPHIFSPMVIEVVKAEYPAGHL